MTSTLGCDYFAGRPIGFMEVWPNMSDFEITYRGTVYPWQCDHMGHMNVMWYVGRFDEASWQLLATLGLTPNYFRNNECGVVAVDQNIEYKRELLAGATITIRSTVLELKDKSLRMMHEMRNDETGEIAATTTIVGVHIDSRLRKACSWPDAVRAAALLKINRTTETLEFTQLRPVV